jgi:hypothetical protein
MSKKGKILISVHGKSEEVPYFSCIMNIILKSIPDVLPIGSPSVHSFGDSKKLHNVLEKAGFRNIIIDEYEFSYTTASFEEYWKNYMEVTANSIRKIIEQDNTKFLKIKDDAEKNSIKFLSNNKIIFPWNVLIASAEK